MSLIEGMDDFITHIKNQERRIKTQEERIKTQEETIEFLEYELEVATAERDQADDYNTNFMNNNIFYLFYFIFKSRLTYSK